MDKTIRIADFITRLADKGYTKKDSTLIMNDVLDVVYEAVSNGECINIMGFGTLQVIDALPKKIRNINTGEVDVVPAHKKIRFTPGATLKRAAGWYTRDED